MGRKRIFQPNEDVPINLKFRYNLNNLKGTPKVVSNTWMGVCSCSYRNYKLYNIKIGINLPHFCLSWDYISKVIAHEYVHAIIARSVKKKNVADKPETFPGEEGVVSFMAEEINSPFDKKFMLFEKIAPALEAFSKGLKMWVDLQNESKMQKV